MRSFCRQLTQSSSTRPGTVQTLSHYSSPARHRGDGVSGNGGVVRTDRRAGQAQGHLNLCGGIHRGAVPGQDGIERAQNASINCT